MNKMYIPLALIIVFNLAFISVSGSTLPDSVITLEHARSLTNKNPEMAEQILNEIRRRKLVEPYAVDRTQGYFYYNRKLYRTAAHYLERVIEYDAIKNDPKLILQPLYILAGSYDIMGNYNAAMDTYIRCIDIAKKNNDLITLAETYQSMGMLAWRNEGEDLAWSYINQAEKLFEQTGDLSGNFWFNFEIAESLYVRERYEEVEPYLLKAEDYLFRLRENKESLCIRDEVMDVHMIQQFTLAANLYHKLGNAQLAQEYFDKYMAIPSADQTPYNILMVPYLLGTKNTQKALSDARGFVEYLRVSGDTLTTNMLEGLIYMIQGHELAGNMDSVVFYARQAMNFKTQELKRERENNAIEIATLYEVQEKEARIKVARTRLRILSVATAVILILLIVITYLLRRKSAAYRILALRAREWAGNEEAGKPLEETNVLSVDKPDSTPSQKDKQIMERVRELMREEFVYRDPELTAESLAARLGLHRNSLSKAVNVITGKNFNRYINEYRIKEGIRILSNKDINPVMEDICDRVGFNNRSSFYRAFKQITGLSPTEFRKSK